MMLRTPIWIGLLLTCAYTTAQSRVSAMPTTKIYRSERLQIQAGGIPFEILKQLGAEGDAFIRQLETQWSVKLPQQLVPVSISDRMDSLSMANSFDLPRWVASGYSAHLDRAIIQVENRYQVDPEPLVLALRQEIVRYLVQPKRGGIPTFIEMGLAHKFSRNWSTRDGYRAVFAFWEIDKLSEIASLEDPSLLRDSDAQVLSFLFVEWFWNSFPEQSTICLHRYLQGQTFSSALRLSGIESYDDLIAEFEASQRPQYGVTRILWTSDALLSLIALIIVVTLIVRIRASWKLAQAGPPIEIEARDLDIELHRAMADLKSKASAAPPRRRTAKRVTTPAPAPTPSPSDTSGVDDIDSDIDAFFKRTTPLPKGDFADPNEARPQPEDGFADPDEVVILDKVSPPTKPRVPAEGIVPSDEIEVAIDDIFTPQSNKEKHSEKPIEKPIDAAPDDDLDDDLDAFFGGLGQRKD